MWTRFLSHKVFKIFLLFSTVFVGGCNEDASLINFVNDMSSIVELEVPVTAALQDPCLLANARAAALWYQSLPERHREALKQNVQRYVHAVKFVKTEIVSGVPTTMARTSVSYSQGTILVATKGVIDMDDTVVCAPDIDVLVEFTVAHSLPIARN
jgi:hypothetical protein